MLTAAQLAEQHQSEKNGSAVEERERRRMMSKRAQHRGGSDELDDWLAQAELERAGWNRWGAPEEYPLQVVQRKIAQIAKTRRDKTGGKGENGGGMRRTTARDVWSSAWSIPPAPDARLLFCPDTRFGCFVQITQRA